jgi:hypothetical protein
MKQLSYPLALCAVLFMAVAFHLSWVLSDDTPPGYDETRTLQQLEMVVDDLHASGGPDVTRLLHLGAPHPPGIWLSALPLYEASCANFRITRAVCVLYLSMSILGTYLLGRHCFSRPAGLLMAVCIAAAPYSFKHSSRLLMEGLLAGVLPFFLIFLLRTDGFSRRPWSAFACGLLSAWMLLIKWTAVIFLVGPILVEIAAAWRIGTSLKSFGKGCGLLVLGTLAAAPWYLANLSSIFDFVCWNESPMALEPAWHPFASRTELGSLLYYFISMDVLLGPLLLVSLLVGIVLTLVRPRRGLVHALATLGGAYIVLTVLISKEPRHLSPSMPVLILLANAWIFIWFRPGRLRKLLAGISVLGVLFYGLFPAIGIAFKSATQISISEPLRLTLIPGSSAPLRLCWRHEELMRSIKSDMHTRNLVSAKVYLIPFNKQLRHFDPEKKSRYMNLPIEFLRYSDTHPDVSFLNRANYIVAVTFDPLGPIVPPILPRVQAVRWLTGEVAPGPPPELVEIWSDVIYEKLEVLLFYRRGIMAAPDMDIANDIIRAGRTNPSTSPLRRPEACAVQRNEMDSRLWIAPPHAENIAALNARFDTNGKKLTLILTAPAGTRFRISYSHRRARFRFPFGITELYFPNLLQEGIIKKNNCTEVLVQESLLGSHIVYFQALLETPTKTMVTNWVAARYKPKKQE